MDLEAGDLLPARVTMTNLARFWSSAAVAFGAGAVGFMVVAVFGPLVYPASLTGDSSGESIVVFSSFLLFLLFGIAGFVLGWKLTKRFAE